MNNGVDLSGTNSDGDDCEDLTTQPHSTLNSGNMPSSRARSGVLGNQTISRTAAHIFVSPGDVQKSLFLRTAADIFVSPGDAPAIITQCVAWMERQFNAYQTPCSIYLSILNCFRVIRCLSQCVSPTRSPASAGIANRPVRWYFWEFF